MSVFYKNDWQIFHFSRQGLRKQANKAFTAHEPHLYPLIYFHIRKLEITTYEILGNYFDYYIESLGDGIESCNVAVPCLISFYIADGTLLLTLSVRPWKFFFLSIVTPRYHMDL